MKTPEPFITKDPSAQDKRIFSFPKQLASACAEVLARLLAGEVLGSLDTLEKCSTTRCAAHVHYLKSAYDVPIVAEERAAGCADGRVSIVTFYRLSPETIHAARAAGAGEWCAQVRKARAALRAKAADAYPIAPRAARLFLASVTCSWR